jgi:transketolase
MVDYKNLAKQARLKVLQMVHEAKTSHIASNFSILDVATVLYENLDKNDEVVWSKGWVAASIYYFLHKQGKITDEQLATFPNAPFFGLAETTVPGVHVSGGSMGHGLPVSVGMALAKKRAGEPGMIYCIMSDGELNEGTTWESVMVAAHHKLDNLCIIVDKNDWQAMGKTSEVLDLGDVAKKFHVFGWDAATINGHSYSKIEKELKRVNKNTLTKGEDWAEVPSVIVANTIKGKGVSFMENHLLYHYKHVEKEDYDKAVAELNAI